MRRDPIRVSVGGGKGGVGKSVVSVNLATTLASIGMRTVLVDADFGAPNLHTLLGVDRVGPTLQALIDRKIGRLEEAMVPTAVPHLSLVAGTSLPGSANLGHQEKLKLVRHVRSLDAEVVIIDVGAGASFNTLDLYLAGDLRLVVTTPELTALQNAYCFLKAAVTREIVALARSLGATESWAAAFDGRDTGRMSTWLDKLGRERPDVARRVGIHVSRFGARWVGNRLGTAESKHAVHALARLSSEFLGIDAPVVANIPSSRVIERSIGARSPGILDAGGEPLLARAFEALAEHVLAAEPPPRNVELDATSVSEAPSESTAEFAQRLGPHLRKDERIATRLPASVRVASGEHDATIVDVSRSGVRVASLGTVTSGEHVEIVVRSPHGMVALRGTVRHTAARAFGVELDAECLSQVPALLPVGQARAVNATA